MYWKFYDANSNISYQSTNSELATQDTFKAYVDTIIPRTPELAEEYGKVQFFGAADFNIDEYMIITLNNYYIPLAKPTADILDAAAKQLLLSEDDKKLYNLGETPNEGEFSVLSPLDRFLALNLLEQYAEYFAGLQEEFQYNTGFINSINSALNRYTMMGYYSEWYGYGSTGLDAPDQRVLECYPLSWKQIGYPGPSLGYRALR